MARYHHRRLPSYPTLLFGHTPPHGVGFRSDELQIWYNNTATGRREEGPHAHAESDECFVVLKGAVVIDVEGEHVTVGAGEFGCFPAGVFHAAVDVQTPAETLMIRAPSVNDKIYRENPGDGHE